MPAILKPMGCRVSVPEIGLGFHDAPTRRDTVDSGNHHRPEQVSRDDLG
jgi:hypothetical protein